MCVGSIVDLEQPHVVALLLVIDIPYTSYITSYKDRVHAYELAGPHA